METYPGTIDAGACSSNPEAVDTESCTINPGTIDTGACCSNSEAVDRDTCSSNMRPWIQGLVLIT